MSSELSFPGFSSRSITSAGVARRLKNTREVVAAEAEATFLLNTAHTFVTRAAVSGMREVLADVHDAITEDPFGGDFYLPLLRGYSNGIGRRVEGFGR